MNSTLSVLLSFLLMGSGSLIGCDEEEEGTSDANTQPGTTSTAEEGEDTNSDINTDTDTDSDPVVSFALENFEASSQRLGTISLTLTL